MLSSNQHVHKLSQSILKFMHMVVHDELPICISQRLQNYIILQIQVQHYSELLKLFQVLDHHQTMILD